MALLQEDGSRLLQEDGSLLIEDILPFISSTVGTSTGLGFVAGVATAGRNSIGTSIGSGTVTATAKAIRSTAGVANGMTAVIGVNNFIHLLSGVIQGASQAFGFIQPVKAFTGNAQGLSNVIGELFDPISRMEGLIQCSSDVHAQYTDYYLFTIQDNTFSARIETRIPLRFEVSKSELLQLLDAIQQLRAFFPLRLFKFFAYNKFVYEFRLETPDGRVWKQICNFTDSDDDPKLIWDMAPFIGGEQIFKESELGNLLSTSSSIPVNQQLVVQPNRLLRQLSYRFRKNKRLLLLQLDVRDP